MDHIPIKFEYQGKQYSGELVSVQGAGDTSVYHLMIDNYYKGRLRKNDKWVFDGKFEDMAEDFGDFLTFLNSL